MTTDTQRAIIAAIMTALHQQAERSELEDDLRQLHVPAPLMRLLLTALPPVGGGGASPVVAINEAVFKKIIHDFCSDTGAMGIQLQGNPLSSIGHRINCCSWMRIIKLI